MDIPTSLVTQMVLIKISGPQKHMDTEKGFGQWKEITGMYKNQECVGVKAVNILHACLKSSKTKHIGRAFRNKDRKYPVKWGSLHTPLTNRFSFYLFIFIIVSNTRQQQKSILYFKNIFRVVMSAKEVKIIQL